MKYAIVDDQKREALPGLQGTCQQCDALMIPKCGRFRMAHWAHSAGNLEHHKEPETEWHRSWKDCFPVACQEVRHQASNGERHIADVKTNHGLVIEFQNSPICEQERRSREEFYRSMYWVVNGQNLKRGRPQFLKALQLGRVERGSPLSLAVPVENCMLLKKWTDSGVLVFFDFGEVEDAGDVLPFGAPVLWASRPRSVKGMAVLTPVYRKAFVEAVINGEPLKGFDFSKVFARARRLSVPRIIPPQLHPWSGMRFRRSWRRR